MPLLLVEVLPPDELDGSVGFHLLEPAGADSPAAHETATSPATSTASVPVPLRARFCIMSSLRGARP